MISAAVLTITVPMIASPVITLGIVVIVGLILVRLAVRFVPGIGG